MKGALMETSLGCIEVTSHRLWYHLHFETCSSVLNSLLFSRNVIVLFLKQVIHRGSVWFWSILIWSSHRLTITRYTKNNLHFLFRSLNFRMKEYKREISFSIKKFLVPETWLGNPSTNFSIIGFDPLSFTHDEKRGHF